MSMTRKKKLTRTFFLGVTVLAIATECWFAWDGDPETDPWTDLIGQYIPWQVALAVFGALLLWVPAHFIARYRRELRKERAEVKRLKYHILLGPEENLPFYYDEAGRRIWKNGIDSQLPKKSDSGQGEPDENGTEQDTLF